MGIYIILHLTHFVKCGVTGVILGFNRGGVWKQSSGELCVQENKANAKLAFAE